MSHPTDERLRAWIDGESSDADSGSVTEHVRLCGPCGERATALRRTTDSVDRWLGALDHDPPAPQPVSSLDVRSPGPAWTRVAALLALGLFGASALLAVPGSPVRRMLDGMDAADAETGRDAPPDTAIRALGIPAQPEMLVVLPAGAVGALNVRLSENEDLQVRVSGRWARFTVTRNRVDVGGEPEPADYRVDVSRAVHSLQVFQGDRPILSLQGGRASGAGLTGEDGAWAVQLDSRSSVNHTNPGS